MDKEGGSAQVGLEDEHGGAVPSGSNGPEGATSLQRLSEDQPSFEVKDRTKVGAYHGEVEAAPSFEEQNFAFLFAPATKTRRGELENSFPAPSGEQGPVRDPTGSIEGPVASRTDQATFGESGAKKVSSVGLSGLSFAECGPRVFQRLLEVVPLRSQSKGRDSTAAIFPLPTSKNSLLECFPGLCDSVATWCLCVCVGLNSLWGEEVFYDGYVKPVQLECVKMIRKDVERFCRLTTVVPPLDWGQLMQIRTIDYKGDEVRVARSFRWQNISPALPKEVGVVPLAEVCTLGSRHYVEHFEEYLKPRDEWGAVPTAKVMVPDEDWGMVCTGLVQSGVCVYLTEDEIFDTGAGPLLNGLFGVSKEEWTDDGTEIYRLIMNLVPLNGICSPMQGDVDTLPSWGSMSPYFLQPSENLLVSSEDVKCFFYTISVPLGWTKFLAFNKLVPDSALPVALKGNSVYMASRVLPMGFLNSVSLAQHVHRNLVLWSTMSAEEEGEVMARDLELKKDEAFSVGNPNWRVYLDNYDLLERVQAATMGEQEGTLAPQVLALRQQYEHWQVPRNVKKSVSRSPHCELQGATINGVEGIAFPRESKLAKYLGLTFLLGEQSTAVQKQWQVACGGLVYFTMFRRPLLSALNRVWSHIEEYNASRSKYRPTPGECQLELFRFLALLPLARLDFRLDVHPQVTCSDASTTGGGVCASVGLSDLGGEVAAGGLRGEVVGESQHLRVLSIGLFDGIGALRVALEALNVKVLAHISVEPNKSAQMVVESQFPGTICIDRVEEVTAAVVHGWTARFSQCDLILIGAGPPCQGVSGLNADRKGALKDMRSNLFLHVPRIRDLVKQHFTWCPVHWLMESVASMDKSDRDVMSEKVGTDPVKCDAGCILWCHRPRLYWFSWNIEMGDGYSWVNEDAIPRELLLDGCQPLAEVIKGGWLKVEPGLCFPTFTTSRPRDFAGRKPAGIGQCSFEEVDRWIADRHRFPPYQYRTCNSLVNSKNEFRLPDVEEREAMLGFAPRYTATCMPKGQRSGSHYNDTRLTLLGNSWAVPIVACLLNPLFSRLGWFPKLTTQEVLDRFRPLRSELAQGRLMRLPLNPKRRLTRVKPYDLAYKLSNLVSIKGEDILLSTPSSQQVKFHRLRASVPARLWRWRTITGWRWKFGREHINALELKAILTAMRWRFEHQKHFSQRIIHLTDSLVCLHALTRGRSSSRKLRRPLCRLNALVLACNAQPVWAYVHTDQNPADRPSRWGRRVRTKFRNAA